MSKYYNLQKQIALAIVRAQIASDAGKGIKLLKFNNSHNRKSDNGYSKKPKFICQAIRLIATNQYCGFNYYIESARDQNGYDSFIVYFEIYGGRQISFHNPAKLTPEYIKSLTGTTPQIKWDQKIGGSRKNCQRLINQFDL